MSLFQKSKNLLFDSNNCPSFSLEPLFFLYVRYDIHDIRSIAYDSLRLASKEVKESYATFLEARRRLNGEDALLQESIADRTFWIYKAKTSDGLFTKEALPDMYAAESTITKNADFPDYCYVDYELLLPPAKECVKPLSVLNIYYASEWNATLANAIVDKFKSDPTKIEMYNNLSPCVELGFFCDLVPPSYSQTDKDWVKSTSDEINSMLLKWDGQGDLNPNVDQVTEFIAYMNELRTKRAAVNFYFDANFSLDNQVSMFSRSMVFWGELLNGTIDVEESDKKLKT